MKKNIDAVANVSLNESFFVFTTMSQGGMDYAEPSVDPHYFLPDADDSVLGAALRMALSQSKRISGKDFIELFNSRKIHDLGLTREKAVMQKYGYKTKRALYKNMLCCWISVSDGKIQIKPTHHKSLDSYSGISNDGPEIQHLSMTVSDAELGAALREGFKRCTSAVG